MLRSAPKAASRLPSLRRYAATAVWSISSSTPDAYLSLVVFAPSAACQLVTSSARAGRPPSWQARRATNIDSRDGPVPPADRGCEGRVISHVHGLPSADIGQDAPGVGQRRGGGLLNQQPGP